MVLATFSLKQDYWETISLGEDDLEVIYDHLLELETPMTVESLVEILVEQRLIRERKDAERKKSEGTKVYLPKETYEVGDKVIFPNHEWATGEVTNLRDAHSPIEEAFKVVEVEFEGGVKREFASELEDHQLNIPPTIDENDP